MSNNIRTRNGLPYNFVNGIKVRGQDIESLIPGIEGIPEAGSKYQFAGNGSNKVFTLPVTPYNKDAIEVHVKQLYVHSTDYTLVGDTITLAEAPPALVVGETYNVEIKVNLTTLNGYVDASRVSFEGENLDDILEKSKPLANYAQLRAYTGNSTQVRITDPGIDGFFYHDPSDITSADNGGTIIVSGNGKRWKRIYSGPVNVKWFGAVGDGVTDDTAAIQAALNAVVASGQELYFPAGTYTISSTLTASGTFRMRGVPSVTYQDYANDIGKWLPSYAGKASIIQFAAGSHGAILNSGNHSIENMVFRCGQTRTSADVFLQDRSLLADYVGCKFENLDNVFGDDTSGAFGPQFARGCRFFSCGAIAVGVVVDATFTGNVFTSCGTVFSLSPGSGYVSIVGNRFEYCAQAFYSFQGRECIFNNNIIDSCSASGARLNSVVGMSIVGNLFWRNGFNGDATGQSHIKITGICTGTTIVGNNFQYGEQDGGGTPRPKYVLELEGCSGSAVQFKGNNTLDGFTVGFVIDTYGTSGACIDADRFDIKPGSFNPNTASDSIGNILDQLNAVCFPATYPIVYVYENRKINGYGKNASNLMLSSGVSTSVALDISAGSMTFDKLNNVSIGGITFNDRSGVTYGSAIPNGYPQQGSWNNGKQIHYAAPSAGGYIGAVKISSGSPDAWKTFGAITP